MLDEACVLRELRARGITPDTSQHSAIAAIVALFAKKRKSLGVYCHGLPGRGKSLVMDTVFALADCPKRRIHFHEFLREIIRRQASAPAGAGDSLVANTRDWLAGVEFLCFDEFHVHDIADAYLVGRFLDTALALGIRVVATSNYAPDGLLPDPLFHDRFQPTIAQIKSRFHVIHFDGADDYRFKAQPDNALRFVAPLNEETAARLRGLFHAWERGPALQARTLLVAGRALDVRAEGKVMLWADFDALCVASRSHLDYLELAERWQALIIDRLQIDSLASPATLQRLVWLVDIFYDRKRMLFVASDQPLRQALGRLDGAHDLSRTLSRLAEMQSSGYGTPHG
jgi:cell division protein ZapE